MADHTSAVDGADHRSAFNDLVRHLSGYVCEPGSRDYAHVVAIDNGRTRTEPAYVIRANSYDDVKHAITFARKTGLPLTVRGGGHSAAGYCLNWGGVVLDLGLMKAMTLDRDSDRLTVQMGATWSDVYNYVANHPGLIPVGGGCLTVGLPGFLLGGGYSFVSRSYGLGSDNVTEIKLVDAAGKLRTLTATADADDRELFWACRGGGGGNFGVAVEMTLKLHRPPTATMLGGELSFPLERAEHVIAAYDAWAEGAPDAMAAYGYIGYDTDPTEPTRKIPTFRITPVYNGEFADGVDLLRPMLRLKPLATQLYAMPLPTWEAAFGKATLVRNRLAYIRSGVIGNQGWTQKMIEALLKHSETAPSKDSFVVWTHGRGQVCAEDRRDQGPYPHRDKRYVFELKAIWNNPTETRDNVEWAFDYGEALKNDFHGAYVNYIDPLQKDWATAYYGGNLKRLKDIKHKADPGPHSFFRFQQSVDSDYKPNLDSRPFDLSPLNRTLY
ncbi:FAD-binding oxidoreductase [Nocardia sp. NBC_00881]|uniref:FAD-dependent oxidoreductase n=1 Tax=Nocardia sp. NBC_00881 TaxID=2975995 RepID=UPI0038659857|nr:FAD-binding oxidoreductase [Nocardia sp. NBC_00881]